MAALLFSAPIDKTIDELLYKEKKALEVPSYDPFKRAKPLLKKKSRKSITKPTILEVSAIMNNKAFFDGRWYQKGDKTAGGKVVKITENALYLKQGRKTKILRLKNKKSVFSIREKGAE